MAKNPGIALAAPDVREWPPRRMIGRTLDELMLTTPFLHRHNNSVARSEEAPRGPQ
jgi:hypothetical protein